MKRFIQLLLAIVISINTVSYNPNIVFGIDNEEIVEDINDNEEIIIDEDIDDDSQEETIAIDDEDEDIDEEEITIDENVDVIEDEVIIDDEEDPEIEEDEEDDFEFVPGVIDVYVDVDRYLVEEPKANLLMASNNKADSLPSRFRLDNVDGKGTSYVTSVKNQGNYGSCWAHAILASAESTSIMDDEEDLSFNLSEVNLNYFEYNNKYADLLNLITNDYSTCENTGDGSNCVFNMGGSNALAMMNLPSGIGFSLESRLKYSVLPSYRSNFKIKDFEDEYIKGNDYCYNNDYLLVNVEAINLSQRDAVKKELMNNGAMAVSYYSDNDLYYNSDTYAYYYDAHPTSNHAVTLVGWDDDFEIENFVEPGSYLGEYYDEVQGKWLYGYVDVTRPSQKGAWIIKNSYGASWGENGYFYISYEDTGLNHSLAYQYDIEKTNPDTRIYQYDGTLCNWSYTTSSSSHYEANNYVAQRDEYIDRIGFFTTGANVDYVAYVYKNNTSNNAPTSGDLVTSVSGTATYGGYHSVKLSKPAFLNEGDSFSVVVKFSGDNSKEFYVDESITYSSWWYNTNSDYSSGQSYYSADASTWKDAADNYSGNLRIKGYSDSELLNSDNTYASFIEGTGIVIKSNSESLISQINNICIDETNFKPNKGTDSITISESELLENGINDGNFDVVVSTKDGFVLSFNVDVNIAVEIPDNIYLGFTSDIHNLSSDVPADRLNNWINNISANKINSKFMNFVSCGDMGKGSDPSLATDTYWTYAQKAIDVIRKNSNIVRSGFFVTGNHEFDNGKFDSSTNATKKYYTTNGKSYVDSAGGYILYSFGATSGTNDDNNYYIQDEDVEALDNFLSNAPQDKPIFIVSHYPLHKYGSRTIHGYGETIDVLNKYGDNHTIIYVWGHSHSEAGSNETHYDQVFTDKITNYDVNKNDVAINFVYAPAGCMGDSEVSSGSANVKAKGLVAKIDNNKVTLTYYGKDYNVVGNSVTVNYKDGTSESTRYTVNFDALDGQASYTSKSVMKDSTYGMLPSATKTNYDFIGWFTAKDGGTQINPDSKANINDNQTLYAHYSAKKVTVYFNANGGSCNTSSKEYIYGEPYGTLPTCTTTERNKTFLGWYTRSDNQGVLVTELSTVNSLTSYTLYAKYGDGNNLKTITLYLNDGSGKTTSVKIKIDNEARYSFIPDVTRVGYTFDGWYTASSGGTRIDSTTKIKNISNNSHNIYAQWTANKYTVTFDTNYQGGTSSTKEVTYDSKYSLPSNPTREGYDFVGWFDAKEGGNQITSNNICKMANNHTLYAHWQKASYTITYNLNGGTNNTSNITKYDEDTNFTLLDPSKQGYKFDGWYTSNSFESNTKITVINNNCSGNLNLYAKWIANKYNVTFNYNYQGSTNDVIEQTYDSAYILPNNPTRDGYDFVGWFDKATGGNEITSSNTFNQTNSNQVLYAHWNIKQYTVTFDSNGGGTLSFIKVNYNGTYSNLPTPSKTGYTFDGWYSEDGNTKVNNDDSILCNADHKLVAHYTENSYKVRFNANGGSGTMSDESFTYTESKSLTANIYARTGYTFTGWALTETGNVKYDDEEEVSKLSGDDNDIVDLYAVWKSNISWSYDTKTKVLTISGSGEMENFSTTTPWVQYNKEIKSIVISNGITTIGQNTFKDCTTVESVTIPNSITSIASGTFKDCSSLKTITLPVSISFATNSFVNTCIENVHLTVGTGYWTETNSNAPWYKSESVKNVILDDGIKEIGKSAFWHTHSLESITIPDSVEKIDDYAFFYCSSLKEIEIPDNVSSIGYEAFMGCSSLESINIPNTLTSIGSSLFNGCSSLKSIYIPSTVTRIWGPTNTDSPFYNCSQYLEIYTDAQAKLDGWDTYWNYYSNSYALTTHYGISYDDYLYWSTLDRNVKSIVIPDGIKVIPNNIFASCTNIESITIPSSITTIGENAFDACIKLKTIFIPSTVLNIYASKDSRSPFLHCYSTLDIFTDAKERQTGWSQYFNYYSYTLASKTLDVYYNYSRNEYNSIFEYSISFDGNGATSGTMNPMNDLRSYKTYTLSNNNFVKTGHEFKSWNTKKDGSGTEYTTTITNPTLNSENGLILYAQWTANEYDITINVNNPNYGSVSSSKVTVPYGTVIKKPTSNSITIGDTTIEATPTKNTAQYKYAFEGWSIEKDTTVEDDLTITANFAQSINKYTVTWKDDDGTTLKTDSLDYGATPSYSGTPTKAATAQYTYTFKGWDKTITTVTEDVIYTATYDSVVNNYDVTITVNNSDYGSVSSSKVTVPYGTVISKPTDNTITIGNTTVTATTTSNDAQYTYKFSKWSIDKDTTVTGALTITANFDRTVNKYTVTWKNYDGTTLKTDSLDYGATPSYSGNNPSKSADTQYTYTFAGWDPTISKVTKDVTYTAKYTESLNKYSVIFNNNGHGTSPNNQTIEYGGKVTDPNKQLTTIGYTFNGWYKEQACTNKWDFNNDVVTGVTNLYAKWVANTYNISYVLDGGEHGENHPTIATYDTQFFVSNPTKVGYSFKGWKITGMDSNAHTYGTYTTSSNTINQTKATNYKNLHATNDATVTFTASWAEADVTFKVKHYLMNLDGTTYTLTAEETKNGKSDSTINISDYDNYYEGFTFDGNKSGTTETIKPDGTTVISIYYSRNKYTVTWKNGDVTLKADSLFYGATPSYSGDTPSKNADAQYTYTFKGWDKTITTVTEDVTYTATYTTTVNKYTVSFNNGGHGIAPSSIANVAYGSKISNPGDLNEDGYVFNGWYVNSTAWNFNTDVVKGDTTLTAKWSEGSASYKVQHYLEKLDGSYELKDTETKTGTTESSVTASNKSYTGFSFDTNNASNIKSGNVIGNGSLVLKLYYKRNTHTVTFKDGSSVLQAYNNIKYGTSISSLKNIPTPTKTGYTFDGWNPSLTSLTLGDQDLTITAKWSEGNTSYTVNHYLMNLDGSSFTKKSTDNKTGKSNTTITIENLQDTFTGFTYDGGKSRTTTNASKPTSYDTSTTINPNGTTVIDLFYSRNKYSLTLNKGTGISSVTGAGSYYYEATVTINATVSTGYTWSKWTNGSSDISTTKQYSLKMDTSALTYTANAKANTYSVRFNANGGSGSMTNEQFTYGISKALTTNAFTRSDYSFAGWATSADGSVVYSDGQTVSNLTSTNGGVVDLYAKWIKNDTPVTLTSIEVVCPQLIYAKTSKSNSLCDDFRVLAKYSNNTSKDVTADCTISGLNLNTIGEEKITVTYGSLTKQFSIYIFGFTSTSLTLEGRVIINFKTQFPNYKELEYTPGILFFKQETSPTDEQINNAYKNSEVIKTYEEDNGVLVFNYNELAAKEMNNNVYAVLCAKQKDGRVVYSRPSHYKVTDYAKWAFSAMSSNTKLMHLIADMLNYGSYAQKYFYGIEPDKNVQVPYANVGDDGSLQSPVAKYQTTNSISYSNTGKGHNDSLSQARNISYTGISISLENEILINYKVQTKNTKTVKKAELLQFNSYVDGGIYNTNTAINKYDMTYDESSKVYSGSIPNIIAKNMRKVYVARVHIVYTDNSEDYSSVMCYSVEDYVAQQSSSSSSNLKNLVISMLRYGDSASNYLDN